MEVNHLPVAVYASCPPHQFAVNKYSSPKYKYEYKYLGFKYEYKYKYLDLLLEYNSSTSTSTKYYSCSGKSTISEHLQNLDLLNKMNMQ